MPGKHSRTKGHQFERVCAKKFQNIGYFEARRHLEYQDGEANGVDLKNTGMFKIQCKAMKTTPNIPKVFKEIECEEEDIPVVVFKVDQKGSYACLDLDHFMSMVEALNSCFGQQL